ncbi:MAG: [FeFe] hydrogenase H-cluster maturation GTPase HydF [Spirochaetes bacterium]|nr:[FeFe] hydrogenase H-cluster maturation GTPase HydF [Spirochaetota bacterium]
MTQTPVSNRIHIGFFGRRNAGKSSLINAITGQELSIVSATPGTTTDPVGTAMELAGIGPVYLYDTAGIDDSGELGAKRVARTEAVLRKINIAIFVTTYDTLDAHELETIRLMKTQVQRLLVVINKSESSADAGKEHSLALLGVPFVDASCHTGKNIDAVKRLIVTHGSGLAAQGSILGGLIRHGSVVLLVVPIDTGAPAGRLILPQAQTIRDVLDHNAVTIVATEFELTHALSMLASPPALVVCDSQAVEKVAAEVPPHVPLTTFSILFSRLKGDLSAFIDGVNAADMLNDGDRVLILETCTHHAQADDIGRVKIPRWLKKYTGKDLSFEVNAGGNLSKDLSRYKLIVSCGACMINRQEMQNRLVEARTRGIPITNYGVLISQMHGVLDRVLEPFAGELACAG